MKFQLFVPPQGYVARRWEDEEALPLLGVLYLGTVARDAGHEVDLVPADVLRYRKADIRRRIRGFGPRVLGVTTCTENRFDTFRVARIAKQVDPDIITVLGGPHITLSGTDTLVHRPEVDVLVFGEGEDTILELLGTIEEDGDLSRVRGIAFRSPIDRQRIITTGPRPHIENLDRLPIPDRSLLPLDQYRFSIKTRDGADRRVANMITSRGCPFNCYFCSTPRNWGRKTRGFSPRRVVDEIEDTMQKYGVRYIWFFDDTFNYNTKRVHAIMDGIIERRLDIRFTCEFRIDLVDEPLLEKMKAAGLELGSFGIEAGNARIRREVVKKDFDIELAYRFVRWSRKYDFIPGAFIIFSNFEETWENSQETLAVIDKMKALNPEVDIATAILHVYPGTPLEKIARETGVMPADFSWARKSDMRKTYQLPAAQGHVPLFKDRLSWFHIADLVMRWSDSSRKRTLSPAKLWQTIRSTTSLKSLKLNLIFFLALLRHRLRGFFRQGKSDGHD